MKGKESLWRTGWCHGSGLDPRNNSDWELSDIAYVAWHIEETLDARREQESDGITRAWKPINHKIADMCKPVDAMWAGYKVRNTTKRGGSMKRVVELAVEQAKELYAKDNSYRTTLLAAFTDEELDIDCGPKRWEELGLIKGVFVSVSGKVYAEDVYGTRDGSQCVTTKARAKKYLAECQLIQLAKAINDGETEEEWVDWSINKSKHTVVRFMEQLKVDSSYYLDYGQINFKRKEDAEFSLKHHRDLWLQYYGMEE